MSAAAAVAIQAFLVHEIYSLDVWWQVAIGRDILAHGSIPEVDRYAAAALGRPYHDSHWLFQVLLACGDRALGMVGVQGVMVGLWAVTLGLCYRSCRRWVGLGPAAVLTFFAAMASVERFLPRPEIVTFAAVSAFYLLLQEGRYRSIRDLLILAAVQVVWANSHGLFVIGPFMVGCYWLAAVALRGRPSEIVATSRALAVVLLATLATPFGLAGWRYAALLATEAGDGGPEVMRSLGELSSTFGEAARSGPAFWFFLALLAAVVAAAVAGLARRRLSPRLLVVAGLATAALSGRRNVVLLALAAAPFLAEALAEVIPRERRLPVAVGVPAAAAMAVWALLPLSGSYYLRMEIPARWGLGVTPSFFPHALPSFLDRAGFEGQVLNSNTLGGFYLYWGYPRRLPLTDGRWEVYEPAVLQRVLTLSRSGAGWRALAAEYEVSGLLLAHTSPEAKALLPALRQAGDWRLVYYDPAASFWMAEGLSGLPPAVDLWSPGSLPPLGRVEDGLLLDHFLARMEAGEPRRVNLRRTVALGARDPAILAQLGALEIQAGRFDDARRTFESLLVEDPNSSVALNELAFLAYRRGEVGEALTLIERALALKPGDRQLQENAQRLRQAAGGRGPAPPGEVR